MAVTNSLKKQYDLPVWEWCRFAPEVVGAAQASCSDESNGGRYIYYMGAANLWRYDTISDGWQKLSGPQIPLLTVGALRYSVYGGYRGDVLSATSNTLTIPALQGDKLKGYKIRIVSGKGAGQERTVTAVAKPTIADFGIATAATATTVVDNQTIPKKWKINQWEGYQCRIVFGTGEVQVRKILYNDTNTLYFSDPNWQHYDHWNNTGFSAIAPLAVPAANSIYYIESSVVTVNTTWTTTPDATSRFVVLSGGIWLFTGRTVANGSAAMQYYDVLSDTWAIKTCTGGMQNVVCSLDVSIERTGEISGAFVTGDCDASGARTMVDATQTWEVDGFCNFQVRVKKTSTGVIQRRRIIGNTATTLYLNKPWDETPDTNFTYEIYGDTNSIWQAGNTRASLLKYLVEEDLWVEGHEYDTGVALNLSALKAGNLGAFSYTATVNTAAMISVNSVPTVKGTGYKVGDICNVTQATGGKVRVTAISGAGVVEGVELYACGTAGTYTTGTGKATSNAIPASGGGSGLTIEITSVGAVARATTAINHSLMVGDTVTLMGATVAGWNATFTITCIDSLTTFEFIPPNSTAPVALASQSVTTLVDASKNWTPGEHVGKLAVKYIGTFPINTVEIRKITANDATTLTVGTWTLPVTGTSRYAIIDMKPFGVDQQFKVPGTEGFGWATGGSSVTLVDSTKSWGVNQWAGYKLRVICGTGFDKGEIAISANDANTLTLTTPGFTPDATTKYEIMETWGLATGTFAATTLADSTKNWAVNQWVGKQLRIICGTVPTIEVAITSNTANVLTYATTSTVSDAITGYAILGAATRGSGIQAMWDYGRTDSEKGRSIYISRGGSTTAIGLLTIDRYLINKDRWDFGLLLSPANEQQTLGTHWAYDGGDWIYWTQTGTVSNRVFRINIKTYIVEPASVNPFAHSTAVQGNRMEIITTEDGLRYLYLFRSSGFEFWRILLWW